MMGYPEVEIQNNEEKFFNSAYILDRKGQLILNYRKHFLYETDKTWCEAGDSFKTLQIETISGHTLTCAVAICMDINPYEFQDNEAFELANFCKSKQIDALFLLTAWNDHEPEN